MLTTKEVFANIQSDLEQAESYRLERKNKLRPYKLFFYLSVAASLVGFIYGGFLAFIILIVSGIVYAVKYSNENKRLKTYFQENIASQIITGIGKDFTYEGKGKISEDIIRSSHLFRDFNRYECEDLVTGTIGNKSFTYAEINLKKHKPKTSSNGSSRTDPVFEGIFFDLQISAKIPVTFYIIPGIEARMLEKVGKWLSISSERGEYMKTGYEPFDKEFGVYATDHEMTKRLLPQPIMDQLLGINKKFSDNKITSKSLSFKFSDTKIQIAIPLARGYRFLEPTLGKPVNTPEFMDNQLLVLNSVHDVANIF